MLKSRRNFGKLLLTYVLCVLLFAPLRIVGTVMTTLNMIWVCRSCMFSHDCWSHSTLYILDFVWQLIALSTWVIEYIERIMKACVMASNASLDPQEQSGALFFQCHFLGRNSHALPDIDLLTLPVLLHVSHPFCLGSLITALGHVRALRSFLGSLPAGSENAKMAQTLLLDTVDCSGVDFEGLIPLLQTHLEAVQKLDGKIS